MMPAPLPPLPLIDGCLFVDNSTLEKYTTCRRSYEYYGLHKRRLREERAALSFGGLVHRCMELRSAFEAATGLSAADTAFGPVEAAQMALVEEHFATNPVLDDDYRNAPYTQNMLIQYNRNPAYMVEPFSVLKDATGKPLIEVPFAHELGTVSYNGQVIRVIWTGRIDRVVGWQNKQFCNWDYKTTSMGGTRFFDEFLNDQAQLGYVWATQKTLGQKINAFVIDAMVCRKPTRTGIPYEFMRQKFELDSDRIDEWQFNTLALIQDLVNDHARGYYPMETKWCVGKYGRCPYLDVCTVPLAGRNALLHGGLFTDVTWSPLNQTKT